jgi:hypothetical protein
MWLLSLAMLVGAGTAADQIPSPILPQTLLSPTPAQLDQFGFSVAGVGDRALVGAPRDDAGATDAGAAYLFDGISGALLQTFLNPTPAASDRFGTSIAGADIHVLVGAPLDDTAGSNAGAAYLFDGDPSSLTFGSLLRTFLNPIPTGGGQFGFSVALVGKHVLVGAPFDDTGGENAGAAYLFDGDPSSPTFGEPLLTLLKPTPAAGDQFGFSVALVGKHVLVGAPFDDTGGSDAGAAYLFDGDPSSPTFGEPLQTFLNPTPGALAAFGFSVGAAGTNALIGAPFDGEVGAAYLFDGNPSSPTFGERLLTLLKPTPAAGDEFGRSVATMETSVLVGAPFDDTGGSDAGAVYVFDRTSGALIQTLQKSNPAATDQFGFSVAAVGDKVLAGAPFDDTGGSDAGAAYLFAFLNRPPTAEAGPAQTVECTSSAGASVALDGSASSDPDDDILTYAWAGPFGTASGPTPTVSLPLGTHTVTLTVDDGKGGTASDTVIVTVQDTTPPELRDVPGPIVAEQAGLAGTPVPVPLPTATDTCGGVIVTSNTPAVFPLGTTTVTFTATDTAGNTTTGTTTVTIVDTTPPSIGTVAATPSVLWPPEHMMMPITVAVSVSDLCDAAPACRIVSVQSNEPVEGLGDGDTGLDWEISGDLTVNLRAERSGTGSTRVYTITVRCTDASGNSSTRAVTVTVPHDQANVSGG